MKAFLFGAGATCGTLGAPTAAHFGCKLGQIDPDWPSHYPAIHKVVQHLGLPLDKWGLEEVWSCMDYYAKLQKAIPKRRGWKNESPDMKKALLTVYGHDLDVKADRLPENEDYTLIHLLKKEITRDDVLVSFNYDTVIERLAERFGICLQVAGLKMPRSGVKLVKPHGSTSWAMDLSNRSLDWCSPSGDPRFDSLFPADVDRGREPILLGTVPIKSELIREVQEWGGFPGIFDTIVRQWRAVVRVVRDADSLIVVGYRFPKEDQYGRFLIQEGLRLRKAKGEDAPKIEFYELSKHACDVEREIMGIMTRVFGPHVRPPVYRDKVIGPDDV